MSQCVSSRPAPCSTSPLQLLPPHPTPSLPLTFWCSLALAWVGVSPGHGIHVNPFLYPAKQHQHCCMARFGLSFPMLCSRTEQPKQHLTVRRVERKKQRLGSWGEEVKQQRLCGAGFERQMSRGFPCFGEQWGGRIQANKPLFRFCTWKITTSL